MADTNKNVVFRRIHGRIIPIRVTNKKEAKQGLGLVAAGIATAAGAGAIYKKAVFGSARLAMKAFDLQGKVGLKKLGQLNFFDDFLKAKQLHEKVVKTAKTASHLASFSGVVRKGGLFAGSALIGLGATKLAASTSEKKNVVKELGIGVGVGTLAFKSKEIADYAFKTGAHGKAGIKEFVREAAPYLKELGKKVFKNAVL